MSVLLYTAGVETVSRDSRICDRPWQLQLTVHVDRGIGRDAFLCHGLFPSVQKKLHVELDKIVGPDRLPAFGDQESMPYLHAVLLETLRWNPIASVGELIV